MNAPAVEVHGLVKEFEKGRRTICQRLRGEPALISGTATHRRADVGSITQQR